jgi:hypothetical protein
LQFAPFACFWRAPQINIIDPAGHIDFGGLNPGVSNRFSTGATKLPFDLGRIGWLYFSRLREHCHQNKSRAVRPCLENLLSLLIQLRFATPSVDHTDSIGAFDGLTVKGLTCQGGFCGVTGEIGAT